MSIEALSFNEKAQIKATIVELNTKYGSGGRVGVINWARRVVRMRGSRTAERPFFLSLGKREGTFLVKFAGQQAVSKRLPKKLGNKDKLDNIPFVAPGAMKQGERVHFDQLRYKNLVLINVTLVAKTDCQAHDRIYGIPESIGIMRAE